MSKGVKSARGVVVDFDLLKIKQQIASAPKPTSVKAREDFVDQRLKRRVAKIARAPVLAAEPELPQEELELEDPADLDPESDE